MKKIILFEILVTGILIVSGCAEQQKRTLNLKDDNLEISSVEWWGFKCAGSNRNSQPIPTFYLHNPDGKYGEVICKIQLDGVKYEGTIYPAGEHEADDALVYVEKSGLYQIRSLEALTYEEIEHDVGVCCYNQLASERREVCKTKKLVPAEC